MYAARRVDQKAHPGSDHHDGQNQAGAKADHDANEHPEVSSYRFPYLIATSLV